MMRRFLRWLFGRRVRAEAYIPALGRDVTPEERVVLINWLKREDTKLALAVAEASRPSVHAANTHLMRDALDVHRAQNFLAILQGWDRFRHAILSVGTPPREVQQVTERFDVSIDNSV